MKITGIYKEKPYGLYQLGNVIKDIYNNLYVVLGTNADGQTKFCLADLENSMIIEGPENTKFFSSEYELAKCFARKGDVLLSGSFEFNPNSEE